jgi:intein/homing endonuclease
MHGTWTNIKNRFGLKKTHLDRIRAGKITIPESLFQQLLTSFDDNQQKAILKSTYIKERNWGQRKGGLLTYSRHPGVFQKGRIIGSRRTKYQFEINITLNAAISELIGAFIGDGFTNHYGGMYVVQFTGHAELDEHYYNKRLAPIIHQMCPSANPIIRSYENTIRLTIYSKELHELLVKRFGFPKGRKTEVVRIPDEILESEQSNIRHCIRGIFDTDGSVFFDRRIVYKRPYPRICLHVVSQPLIQQVHHLLIEDGIQSRMTWDGTRLHINGQTNCRRFCNLIGFSNKRHLSKLTSFVKT